jgi:dephospho-CoA kinase
MTHSLIKNQEVLSQLIETIHRLRAPGGCPWDRAQTHQSLRPHLIEEAYEVLDVLDQIENPEDLKNEGIRSSLREELGDLLMQVLLHSEMTHEAGAFDIYDVAKTLNEKLIRRHPHVFGTDKAGSADVALQRWEKEKAKEKAAQPHASVLDGVPKSLPALQKAARVIEKVTKVGFQWNDMNGPLEKVEEELNELKVEVLQLEEFQKNPTPGSQESQIRQRVESELGDLFFTLCNIAYLMKINPEASLRGTVAKFESRFKYVERQLKKNGKTPEESNLEEMDRLWDDAKKVERAEVWGLTGGIASGKSTVGKLMIEAGIPVIDADLIAKQLSEEGGAAHQAIQARFGTTDRAALRQIVFSDPAARKDLEAILHPMIQAESRRQIEELGLKHSIVVYEASLLVEANRQNEFTGLIVVEAPKPIRVQRLLGRGSIRPEEAEKIIASQISDEDRRKHADVIIENSGDLTTLKGKVLELIQQKAWKGSSG